MEISVVIPVFNEEKNLPFLYKRLKKSLSEISSAHEIIFVNDGSTDKSVKLLKFFRRQDKKIKIISFSRNFGHMAAVNAGLAHASGKKVVIMDADLQDPPEVIPKMYEKAKKEFDVVYGVKRKRKEGPARKLLFRAFYRILDSITQIRMPVDAGTFSLVDAKIVKVLNSLPERNKYFSGLRAWTGFSQTGIVYERGKRHAGRPASIGRLINLAINGMVSFSHLPLRIASFLGIFLAIASIISIAGVLIARFVFGKGIVGWASTMTTILFIGSVQLITLGVIGEYLARIYDEVKNRPEYIIKDKEGFTGKR